MLCALDDCCGIRDGTGAVRRIDHRNICPFQNLLSRHSLRGNTYQSGTCIDFLQYCHRWGRQVTIQCTGKGLQRLLLILIRYLKHRTECCITTAGFRGICERNLSLPAIGLQFLPGSGRSYRIDQFIVIDKYRRQHRKRRIGISLRAILFGNLVDFADLIRFQIVSALLKIFNTSAEHNIKGTRCILL